MVNRHSNRASTASKSGRIRRQTVESPNESFWTQDDEYRPGFAILGWWWLAAVVLLGFAGVSPNA